MWLRSIALLLLASSGMALAQRHPCAAEPDPAARLACYDQAYPPVQPAPVPRIDHAAPAVAEQAEPSRAQIEDRLRAEFGLSRREVIAQTPPAERVPEVDRITATVVEVTAIRGGQRLVRLTDDQVWQLTEGGTRGPLKPGDTVVLRRGLFGSHQLLTPGGVALRARRVR